LRAFERKARPAIAMIGMDAHHVRAMFWARTIGRFFEPGNAKHKADQFFLHECAQHQSAVVNGGDQHVHRDDIRFGVGPDSALQIFNEAHFFRCFNQVNVEIGHV